MKFIKVVMLLFILLSSLVACDAVDEETLEKRRQELSILEEELSIIENKVIKEKIEKGLEKYVLTIEIKQKHYTLDFEQHMKNKMNAIELEMPVDKEYYDSFEIGDKLDETFRMGSLLFSGSYGSWDIEIINKEIK